MSSKPTSAASRPDPSLLKPIDDLAAIRALARLSGSAADKKAIARTIGLLMGRVEVLCDVIQTWPK